MKIKLILSAFVLSLLCFSASHAWAAPEPEAVLKVNPRSATLNEQGAAASMSGNNVQAEKLLREAVIADKNNLTAVFNLAGVYMLNKKDDAAIAMLKDYATRFPKDAALHARLGDAYFSSKQLEEASASYQAAFALDPKYPNLAARLGTVASLKQQYVDAEKYLLIAAEQSPRDAQTLANLSSVQLANGKATEAIATAKVALQVKITSDLYVTLGTAYETLKDYKNSLIAFERARDLGDERKEVEDKISDLKKLSS